MNHWPVGATDDIPLIPTFSPSGRRGRMFEAEYIQCDDVDEAHQQILR